MASVHRPSTYCVHTELANAGGYTVHTVREILIEIPEPIDGNEAVDSHACSTMSSSLVCIPPLAALSARLRTFAL